MITLNLIEYEHIKSYYFLFLATSLSTFITIFLLFLQCIRRFYETLFVQVFSTNNKINITHYFVGYFHYFGAFLIVVSKAPGFNHYENKNVTPIMFNLKEISIIDSLSIILFLYAWIQQYKTNLILANLRKNNLGNYKNIKCVPRVQARQRSAYIFNVYLYFSSRDCYHRKTYFTHWRLF